MIHSRTAIENDSDVSEDENETAQQSCATQRLVLFGSPANQAHMLRIARRESGHVDAVGRPLRNSGLLALSSPHKRLKWTFDQRHPAYLELLQTMCDIGAPNCARENVGVPTTESFVSHTAPLGHLNPYVFRVLAIIVNQEHAVTWQQLKATVIGPYVANIQKAVMDLSRDGVISVNGDAIGFSRDVPESFKRLVARISSHLAESDGRYSELGELREQRPAGFMSATDLAPILFGTDTRLRHLMALAREGPLHLTDLRKITGVNQILLESGSNAPFGRAGVVRVWDTNEGPAAMLDQDLPVAADLRRLLLRLLEKYPLPPLVNRRKTPAIPERHKWIGDYHVMFGGEIATSILYTIGALGWTFTALSASALPGIPPESVRAACARLESDGIIESDRPPRPGMDARILRLAENFFAREELGVLLRNCVKVWAAFASRANIALQTLSQKTKAHLRKRGLIEGADTGPDHRRYTRMPHQPSDSERQACIDDYYGLSSRISAEPSSSGLVKANSRLYRRIRIQWGTFAAFRADLGLRRVRIEAAEPPDPARRERCVAEYREYADYLGRLPTSEDLRRTKGWLYQRINQIWGGFPEFCENLGVKPTGRRRSARATEIVRRARCIDEYRELIIRLGRQPKSPDLARYTDGLYKRIKKVWGGFPEFCDEIGMPANGGRNRLQSLPIAEVPSDAC